MGVRVLFDEDEDTAALVDSVTGVAFGRVFEGDAIEKAEAFLSWYGKHGAYPDPRVDPNIVDAQDKWLAGLDDGCTTCDAEPWDGCVGDPHAREKRP